MDGELKVAIRAGDIRRVKLLVQGGASIAETDKNMSALNYAAVLGDRLIIEWLLAKGGANLVDVDEHGFTALLYAAFNLSNESVTTVQWLLEHGGADIADTSLHGRTVWHMFIRSRLAGVPNLGDTVTDRPTTLLRVMVLRSAPPTDLVAQMAPQHSRVVAEGAQLRAGLPAYLARRRALLAEHTSLIAPLRALVSGYEEPTTTEELWATGLGALGLP
jgi:hypothetical protein